MELRSISNLGSMDQEILQISTIRLWGSIGWMEEKEKEEEKLRFTPS